MFTQQSSECIKKQRSNNSDLMKVCLPLLLVVAATVVACAAGFASTCPKAGRSAATFSLPSIQNTSDKKNDKVSSASARSSSTWMRRGYDRPLRTIASTTTTALQLSLSESDQTVVGVMGTAMALVTLWSEFTLKTTGCGLPAGPGGILGAVEGISYLGIIGIAAYSSYTKLKTGKGLPAGPAGVLGAAEGLSFLAVAAGLVVLGFQIVDYGYIPNAVPMEGGMCS